MLFRSIVKAVDLLNRRVKPDANIKHLPYNGDEMGPHSAQTLQRVTAVDCGDKTVYCTQIVQLYPAIT